MWFAKIRNSSAERSYYGKLNPIPGTDPHPPDVHLPVLPPGFQVQIRCLHPEIYVYRQCFYCFHALYLYIILSTDKLKNKYLLFMENTETGQTQNPEIQNQLIQDRIQLPNATAVLVLGIFSIVTSWCCGIFQFVGLTLGIISLALSSKAQQLFNENPRLYTESSMKNLNAGKVCAIIGLVFSGLIIMIGIIYLMVVGATLGTIFSSIPWENIFN